MSAPEPPAEGYVVLDERARRELQRLDLNLLISLDALLAERSVTQAAHKLGLTQPTLSGSLRRLRRHFRDELLYRTGNSYALTPLAAHLAGRTGAALDAVRRIFGVQPEGDPTSSTRQFTLVCSDYCGALAGPPLVQRLGELAPGVSVHLRHIDPLPFTLEPDRLRGVDGLIMPRGLLDGVPGLDLFDDRWVGVADRHSGVAGPLGLAEAASLPWISTYQASAAGTVAMRQLSQLGLEPQVQAVTDSFLSLPHFLRGSNRLAVLPERLAVLLQESTGLQVLELPFEVLPIRQRLWWHQDFERDTEHAWFRSVVASLFDAPAVREDAHRPDRSPASGIAPSPAATRGETVVTPGSARPRNQRTDSPQSR